MLPRFEDNNHPSSDDFRSRFPIFSSSLSCSESFSFPTPQSSVACSLSSTSASSFHSSLSSSSSFGTSCISSTSLFASKPLLVSVPEDETKSVIYQTDISIPFTEYFRPQKFSDLIGNKETIEKIKNSIHFGYKRHAILTGPPGVGKTSTLECLVRHIFPDEQIRQKLVLSINASFDRTKELFDDKLDEFLKKKVQMNSTKLKRKKPKKAAKATEQNKQTKKNVIRTQTQKLVNYRIVIFDEVDGFDTNCFRRLEELCVKVEKGLYPPTRFFFACNNVNRIPKPLEKYCDILHFDALTESEICKRLQIVVKKIGMKETPEGLLALALKSEGDMRNVLNTLHQIYVTNPQTVLTWKLVHQFYETPCLKDAQTILRLCFDRRLREALVECQRGFFERQDSLSDVIESMRKVCVQEKQHQGDDLIVPFSAKPYFMFHLMITKTRSEQGINTQIQLTGLLARLCAWEQSFGDGHFDF